MKNLVTRFLKDESGATAIEYGLIAAGVAVTIIGALKSLGKDLTATFKTIRKALWQATGMLAPGLRWA